MSVVFSRGSSMKKIFLSLLAGVVLTCAFFSVARAEAPVMISNLRMEESGLITGIVTNISGKNLEGVSIELKLTSAEGEVLWEKTAKVGTLSPGETFGFHEQCDVSGEGAKLTAKAKGKKPGPPPSDTNATNEPERDPIKVKAKDKGLVPGDLETDGKLLLETSGTGKESTEPVELPVGLLHFVITHKGSGGFMVELYDSVGELVYNIISGHDDYQGTKKLNVRRAGMYTLKFSTKNEWSLKVYHTQAVQADKKAPESASDIEVQKGDDGTLIFK